MTSRENPQQNLYYDLLPYASHTITQTSTPLDIQGYPPPLSNIGKGAESASFLLNVGVWTSGIWTPTLYESDSQCGPFTFVDPLFVRYYINGYKLVNVPTIASVADENKMYSVSYVGGLRRYIQLVVTPTAAGTLIFGALGIVAGLRETQDKVYTDYNYDGLMIPVPPPGP